MTAYYNEFDPYAAAWLRNLIAAVFGVSQTCIGRVLHRKLWRHV